MARSLSALILALFASVVMAAVPVAALVAGAIVGYLGGSAIGMATSGNVQNGAIQTTAPIPVPGGAVNAPVSLPVNKKGIADMFQEHMNNGGVFTPQGRQVFCDWLGPGYVCGDDGLYVPADPPPDGVVPTGTNDYPGVPTWAFNKQNYYSFDSFCAAYQLGSNLLTTPDCAPSKPVCRGRTGGTGQCLGTSANPSPTCPNGGTVDYGSGLCKYAPLCRDDTVRYSDGSCRSGEPELRRATDQDYDNLPEMDDGTAQQILDSGTPLPVGKPEPKPFSEPLGPPYPAPTAENPNRHKQDVINGSPIGSTINTVTYNITTTTIINNNYNPATDGPNLPGVNPANPAPEDMQEEPKDPCMENPNRLACIEGGEPPDVPDLEREEVPIQINPVSMGSGFCPANKTASFMGKSLTISWAPICDGAIMMRPVVIAIAWLSAALIVVGAFRE